MNPVFIIAEVGINHNGSLKLAKKMVDVAKNAGVSCVKFQTHIAEKEMIKSNIKPGNLSKQSLWDIIKKCELSETDEEKIINYCKKKKIFYLSTPFSIEAVNRLEKLKIKAYKIGSGELTNIPFLERILQTHKPVILSTGMSTIKEIKFTVNLFKKEKIPLVLLQTTSTYPSKYSEIKLGLIQKFEKMFNVPVGLSDHSLGIYTSLGAVAKGACVIEKHFTLDPKLPGPDQWFSLTPKELQHLVTGCNAVKSALGDKKQIIPRERPILKFARATVFSITHIKKNELFSTQNISARRPGIGKIPATQFKQILGKRAKRSVSPNKSITWSDVS